MDDNTAVFRNEKDYFVRVFGHALRSGVANLVVGAGLSIPAGYPSWEQLLNPLCACNKINMDTSDYLGTAQKIERVLGREEFENVLLKELCVRTKTTTINHKLIDELKFRNLFTTNYDMMLEDTTSANTLVVMSDSSFSDIYPAQIARQNMLNIVAPNKFISITPRGKFIPVEKTIVKLHGSLQKKTNGDLRWGSPPIITTTDYQEYKVKHPLLWEYLYANYLTSSFLFIGFSFADPNFQLVLNLANMIDKEIIRHPHFAIMRVPQSEEENNKYKFLSESGIRIVGIENYSEIPVLLMSLQRNSSPISIFVSGSEKRTAVLKKIEMIGEAMELISDSYSILSFGSRPSLSFAAGMRKFMKHKSKYHPERIKYYYREKIDDGEPPHPQERGGTAIYTELPLAEMRDSVIPKARCLLVFGVRPDSKTVEEISFAQAHDIPVVRFNCDMEWHIDIDKQESILFGPRGVDNGDGIIDVFSALFDEPECGLNVVEKENAAKNIASFLYNMFIE